MTGTQTRDSGVLDQDAVANVPLMSLFLLNKLDEGAGFNDDILYFMSNATSRPSKLLHTVIANCAHHMQ